VAVATPPKPAVGKSPVNDHCKRRVDRKKNIFFEDPRRSIPADTTLFKPPIFGGFRPATVSEFDALAVWRRDNDRAAIKNRIKELGRHFRMKGRCGQKFWSTDAACHLVIAADNLCVLRQRRLGQPGKCEQVTLRWRLFTRPAVFSRARARRPQNSPSKVRRSRLVGPASRETHRPAQLPCNRVPPSRNLFLVLKIDGY